MAASSLYRDIPAPAEDVDRAHGKLTLAWCLHEVHPDARIRLAVPFGANERLNILATIGDQVVAIELKYPTRRGLVFFEAKDFSNPEIRASGDTIPAVVEQICCYRDLLATNRDQVEAAYRTVFELLMAMDGRAIRNQARDAMMLAVLEGRKRLVVDTNPRVVLFGYDDAQRQAWSSHETKLRGALGPGILLMRGNPTGFTNGISANLG